MTTAGWPGVQKAMHLLLFCWFAYVWVWHFTSDQAQQLPGAKGFGRFFRYLTFYSYTLQTAALCTCTAANFLATGKKREWLLRMADDCSCALFPLANVVTVLYFTIQHLTRSLVEGGEVERPWWLGLSVHVLNTVTAWADLLLASPRSFSPRSQTIAVAMIAVYTLWILVCRRFNGRFPYPFLEHLPFPQGFFFMLAVSCALAALLFQFARLLRRSVHRSPPTAALRPPSAAKLD